ncbi:putative ABC transporter permease [Clostridium sp. MSJ-4]|uniref:ABC transporter permease n=1 Tax=Clostridium simiarum TaxID=2841506 RepID=A0ABS6EWQ5_9CLOT|nr:MULTISPECIES: putative ABC transporter permease [Clostridium]MBU5590516.1 putative ABC transporter permease [Clostridium simiarum]
MYNTILGFSIYNILFYFVIYSFIGWCTEVAYAFYNQRKFVNRGFLNGPFCPIYGFGSLILIVFLNPFKSNILLLFILSLLLTSLLEYITGYILETIFNTRWWDYRDNAFNIKGRVCLSFSVMWGVVSIFLIKVLHPPVENFINNLPSIYGIILFYIFIIYFIIDFSATLMSLIEFKNIIIQLDEISNEIKDKYSFIKDKAKDKAEEIEISIKELKSKHDNIMNNIKFKHKRLLSAFPDVSSKNFDSIIKEIQNKIKIKK